MTTKEQLIDQHIREYESRLKHIDELYVQAKEATEHLHDEHETHTKIDTYGELLADLQRKAEEIKTMHPDKWRTETAAGAGPMAIWDVIAQKLEDLIEHHSDSDKS